MYAKWVSGGKGLCPEESFVSDKLPYHLLPNETSETMTSDCSLVRHHIFISKRVFHNP